MWLRTIIFIIALIYQASGQDAPIKPLPTRTTTTTTTSTTEEPCANLEIADCDGSPCPDEMAPKINVTKDQPDKEEIQHCPVGFIWNNNHCVQGEWDNCPKDYVWRDNQCVFERIVCPTNFKLIGNECLEPSICPPTHTLDDEKRCVPREPDCPNGYRWNGVRCETSKIQCQDGSVFVEGKCVFVTITCPNGYNYDKEEGCIKTPTCEPGYEYQDDTGLCILVVISCPEGSFLINGTCQKWSAYCPKGFDLIDNVCKRNLTCSSECSTTTTTTTETPDSGEDITTTEPPFDIDDTTISVVDEITTTTESVEETTPIDGNDSTKNPCKPDDNKPCEGDSEKPCDPKKPCDKDAQKPCDKETQKPCEKEPQKPCDDSNKPSCSCKSDSSKPCGKQPCKNEKPCNKPGSCGCSNSDDSCSQKPENDKNCDKKSDSCGCSNQPDKTYPPYYPYLNVCPEGYIFFNNQCYRCPDEYSFCNGHCLKNTIPCAVPHPPYYPPSQNPSTININIKFSHPERPLVNSDKPTDIVHHIEPVNNTIVNVNNFTHPITLNNVNENNVYIYTGTKCADGSIRTTVIKNNETITSCVDVDGETTPKPRKEEFESDENQDEKCCEVVTPRQCKKRHTDQWMCTHRRYRYCGKFCIAERLYMRPPTTTFHNNILTIAPAPENKWMKPCFGRDCPSVDCTGCINGSFDCSPQCYTYPCSGSTCTYIDAEDFCENVEGNMCEIF